MGWLGIVSMVLEILGFAMAVLDFSGLSARIEAFLDHRVARFTDFVDHRLEDVLSPEWNFLRFDRPASWFNVFFLLWTTIVFWGVPSNIRLIYVENDPVAFLGAKMAEARNNYPDWVLSLVPEWIFTIQLYVLAYVLYPLVSLLFMIIACLFALMLIGLATYQGARFIVFVLHLMNKPRQGIVGTVGFAIAITGFSLGWYLRL